MYLLCKGPLGLNNSNFCFIFCYIWFIRGRYCTVFCSLLRRFLKVHPKAILKWSGNFVEWSGKSQGIWFFNFCGNPVLLFSEKKTIRGMSKYPISVRKLFSYYMSF